MAGYATVSLLKASRGLSVREFTLPDDRDFASAIDVFGWLQPAGLDRQAGEALKAQAWLQARDIVASNWQRMAVFSNEIVRRCCHGDELATSHVELTPEELANLVASAA